VYAPLYIDATEKIINIEGMYQMYDSIARKYNIPILDYNYDPISYDTIYFYNATHLNKKGAELFSVKLAHDIDTLGILKKIENCESQIKKAKY
jgi:lysophospholipase L1-like esterase